MFMNTQILMSSPPLPPPVILCNHLLLAQTSSVTRVADLGNVASETLKVRAAQITVVLREILEQPVFRHGGINE
jgi:hypothetical protein